MSEHKREDYFALPDAPSAPWLAFRGYRGEVDLPAFRAVIGGQSEADGTEWVPSLEDIARNYRHMVNCDPYRDLLVAEADGQVVGYTRVFWDLEADGLRIYSHFAHLLPRFRVPGLREAMLRWNERRLREIRAELERTSEARCTGSLFQVGTQDTEVQMAKVVEELGYHPVRFGFAMVRPDLEAIPDLPLPEGLEVRPVQPEDVRAIWEASHEAFRDHWGFSEDEWHEEHFQAYREDSERKRGLWQVAWEGGNVAGAVHVEINEEENQRHGRLRGYTEGIFVSRPWRRRGVAKALIARGLKLLKEKGMAEAGLGVDADNPNGALQLYKSMGFRVVHKYTTYRKEMD